MKIYIVICNINVGYNYGNDYCDTNVNNDYFIGFERKI